MSETKGGAMELFDLTGSVAAVIGGTGVLGGAVCHGLGRAGAAIAVMGRSLERGRRASPPWRRRASGRPSSSVDATDRASLEAARRAAEERLGPVERPRQRPGRQQLDAVLRDRRWRSGTASSTRT